LIGLSNVLNIYLFFFNSMDVDHGQKRRIPVAATSCTTSGTPKRKKFVYKHQDLPTFSSSDEEWALEIDLNEVHCFVISQYADM
jgi:hypothetical protein